MAHDFSDDQTLKPWVRNLIALFKIWRSRRLIPQVFQALSGGEQAFLDIQAVRNIVRQSVPYPRVYYVGIGNIGALNIDLIYPLLAADFSELIAVDIGPRERGSFLNKFIQAVTLNLSLIDEINQEEIHFAMLGDDSFSATFVYDGIVRDVRLRTNFNAATACPEGLQYGYQVLFTRRTNALFTPHFINSIPEDVRDKILGFLAPPGIAIFQELLGDSEDMRRRVEELLRWLGSDFEVNFASASDDPSCDKVSCFRRKK